MVEPARAVRGDAPPGIRGLLRYAGLPQWAIVLVLAASVGHAHADGDGRREAVDWIVNQAIPFRQVDPGEEIDDLKPIGEFIGGARVVAMGEATHGSREFFQLKHRVFQYLVREKGFRTFAIEANFAAALAIDHYIKSGEGDAEELVNALGFWTWDTEEVIDLVQWMRNYNRSHADQLNFYGFDIQDSRATLRRSLSYLEELEGVDFPNFRLPFDDLLRFADLSEEQRQSAKERINSPASILAMQRAAVDLYLYIDRNADTLAGRTGLRSYELARGNALATSWAFIMALPADLLSFHRSRSNTEVRDRAMADLVHWVRDLEGAEEGIMLWAHNAHVSMTNHEVVHRMMGRLLNDELGDDYYSIGFAFASGSFQARPPGTGNGPRKLTEFTVGAADADSIGGVLGEYSADVFFIDLNSINRNKAARDWFEQPRRMRYTGALYSTELEAGHPPIEILKAFDALIFVRETTRARPSKRTRERFGLDVSGAREQ